MPKRQRRNNSLLVNSRIAFTLLPTYRFNVRCVTFKFVTEIYSLSSPEGTRGHFVK